MRLPWGIGIGIALPWQYHETDIGIPAMGLPCAYRGAVMIVPWDLMAQSWLFHGTPRSWRFHGAARSLFTECHGASLQFL